MTLINIVLKVAFFFYAEPMIVATKLMLFIIAIFVSFSSYSLETDNYIVWDKELDDSSKEINNFFNEKILEVASNSQGASCSQITKNISKEFASYFVNDDPIANWLMQQLDSSKMYPINTDYVLESIYRDPFLFYIPKFGLAPNIQVRGRYFGMDKLSHFGATGMHYFNIYRKALSQGKSQKRAMEQAISYGIREENTLYGYWASGVFSFADLEANFQGMQFYINLCSSRDNTLISANQDGSWKLNRLFDFKDYINSFWDESYNLSYRLSKNWKKVAKVIKQDYCPLTNSSRLVERFKLYSKDIPSFSVRHLEVLQQNQNPKIPDPRKEQSLDSLCL